MVAPGVDSTSGPPMLCQRVQSLSNTRHGSDGRVGEGGGGTAQRMMQIKGLLSPTDLSDASHTDGMCMCALRRLLNDTALLTKHAMLPEPYPRNLVSR